MVTSITINFLVLCIHASSGERPEFTAAASWTISPNFFISNLRRSGIGRMQKQAPLTMTTSRRSRISLGVALSRKTHSDSLSSIVSSILRTFERNAEELCKELHENFTRLHPGVSVSDNPLAQILTQHQRHRPAAKNLDSGPPM